MVKISAPPALEVPANAILFERSTIEVQVHPLGNLMVSGSLLNPV